MIKKILFYVAAFAVSLVFASSAYATGLDYSVNPDTLKQVNSNPVAFSDNDYNNGYFDTHTDYTVTSFQFKNDEFKNMIDNSLNTAFTSTEISTSSNFVIELDEARVITSYYKKYNYGNIIFYGEDNKIIYTQPENYEAAYHSFPSSIPVKKIKFVSLTGGTWFSVTEFEIFINELVYLPVSDISVDAKDTSAEIKWKLPKSLHVDHINFNGTDVGKSVNYIYKNLDADKEYKVNIDVIYDDGTVVTAEYTFKTDKPKDIIPPGEVTDFKGDPDKTFVDLSWSLPTDEDYEKLLLYRDNVLIKTLTTETSYKDEKLNEDTTYKYKIITVDKTGNKSEGKTITVLTKFTQTNLPPEQPLGLTAKPLSKGVKLSWKNPSSGSVKGYKIYMFEKDVASNNILDKFVITAHAASTPTQVNTGLLSSTSYQVSGLENGTAYGFYIVAVNSSGLSSVPSNTVYATPTINSVPPVNIGGGGSGSNGSNNAGFALSDVTNGVSTWFGGIWLILAFAIGIMVSFIIANRIKKLFVA